MQKAAFSLTKYQFPIVNIDLSNHQKGDLDVNFETKGVFSLEDSEYELTFNVFLSTVDNKENSFVRIQCNGIFKFEHVTSYEEIPDFFFRNCIAILFPYVRAYLSLVTSQANVPSIILPTLNLSNLEGDLRLNTTQK